MKRGREKDRERWGGEGEWCRDEQKIKEGGEGKEK